MSRKLVVAAVLAVFMIAGSFAQEDGGASVDAWVGVSPGDVLSGASFATKYGVVLGGLFGTGVEAGIDELTWTVAPDSSADMDAYIVYGFDAGDSPFAFGLGVNGSVAFEEDVLIDAGVYGTVGYSVNDVEVAAAELDAGILSANEVGFGLSLVVGGGYEFSISQDDALALWVDFTFDLYNEFAVGDIESSVEYTHAFTDGFALSLAVAPTLVVGEETDLALEPTLYARFAF